MRIVRMYSGNVAGSQDWKKVEIEVDENDLSSLLYEAGVFLTREKISSRLAFLLLTAEAEIHLLNSMVLGFNVPKSDVQDDLDRMKKTKENVLNKLLESAATNES